MTVTAGNGVTTVAIEHPSPPPAIELPADLDDVDDEDEDADEMQPESEDADDDAGPPACETGEQARTQARERVASAFVQFRSAIDELRGMHRHAKATETLERADAMLREIAERSDRALTEMCEDVAMVADRAVAAMETVVNLARSAAAVTPSPKPTAKPKATPRPTEKSERKATAKPARTPGCDDRLYENKAKMVGVFERYHTLHDKLYASVKRSASASTVKTLLANDRTMHATYDDSKRAIVSAGCAGDLGASAVARAAATFERAYLSSAAAVAAEGR